MLARGGDPADHSEGFPGGSDGKGSPYNAGDMGSISGSGRSPGGGMAIHSNTFAWRIPWTEEPHGLQSIWSQRVRHDRRPLAHVICPGGSLVRNNRQCRRHKRHRFDFWVRKILWRRQWQLTLVFLPGESHGQRSLMGYSPPGSKK